MTRGAQTPKEWLSETDQEEATVEQWGLWAFQCNVWQSLEQ